MAALLFIKASFTATAEPAAVLESLTGAGKNGAVIERGKDSAVIQTVSASTNLDGRVEFSTNQFTLLENGLHYFSDGEWKVSRDIVEPFPDGAIARYGPNKAIFSSELSTEAVFDIETAEGHRIRGGVRSIQLRDSKTGRTVVLGTVKQGVRGEIIPPNSVVYRLGFDGIEADVLLVWRHNSISQNVVLLGRPSLPEGMDPATTWLEVLSELVESPTPIVSTHPRRDGGTDDVTIALGSMVAVRGRAFPVAGEKGLVLTGASVFDEGGVPVAKEFFHTEDGRRFIIESVVWEEIQPYLASLKTAAVAQPKGDEAKLADNRIWPRPIIPSALREPLQLAALPYRANGFLVDIDLSGSVSSYTFLSGTTYYIAQSFYVSGTATTTIRAGCVLKYGNDAWLIFHCPVATPPTGQLMPVLTSKDDDDYGAMIPGSTHTPTFMASRAIWMYYVDQTQTELNNLRIRWAKKGIQFDAYVGNGVNHKVKDSLFQNCLTGIHAEVPDGSVTLVNVKKCDVTTPFYCNCDGSSGSMADECGPFYTVANYQGILQADVANNISIPDTIGAVGPHHFMALLNGQTSVAVYNKYTGERLSPASTTVSDFFSITIPSGQFAGSYPTFGPIDPQIIFDRQSQRWIACAFNNALQRHVFLAISRGPDPIGSGGTTWVMDNWDKYLVPISAVGTACTSDRPKLGVDANGIYISVYCGVAPSKIAALPKAQFTNGLAGQVQTNFFLSTVSADNHQIWPALNFEPIGSSDPVWFIFDSKYSTALRYNKLKWVNGFSAAPQWETGDWGNLPTASKNDAIGIYPPQSGSTTKVQLQAGSMLLMAFVKSLQGVPYLWTCHEVGVNANGNGEWWVLPIDRVGVAWYKVQLSGTVEITETGRIYDSAPTNPKHYYMPSMMVNNAGDLILGFSGSSASQYVGAFYCGKKASGSMGLPIQYFAGKDSLVGGAPDPNVGSPIMRWGDYSGTVLDPDGKIIWMIQEYAETKYQSTFNAWGTRIGAISP